jgi:hypothetical protein
MTTFVDHYGIIRLVKLEGIFTDRMVAIIEEEGTNER